MYDNIQNTPSAHINLLLYSSPRFSNQYNLEHRTCIKEIHSRSKVETSLVVLSTHGIRYRTTSVAFPRNVKPELQHFQPNQLPSRPLPICPVHHANRQHWNPIVCWSLQTRFDGPTNETLALNSLHPKLLPSPQTSRSP